MAGFGRKTNDVKFLGISGSLRRGSVNTALIRAGMMHVPDVELEWADVRLPLYDNDLEDEDGIPPAVQKLADQIAAASAVILSTPEYNQSLSGVMKNALDWVSRVDGNPWAGKPVLIMAAASGRSGGARATYALRLAMTPFQPLMVPSPEVLLPKARSSFNSDGTLSDAATDKRLKTAMERLRDAAS